MKKEIVFTTNNNIPIEHVVKSIDKRQLRLLARNCDAALNSKNERERKIAIDAYIEGYREGFYKTNWK